MNDQLKKYYAGLIRTYYRDGSFRSMTSPSKMLEGATFVWGDGRPMGTAIVTVDTNAKVIKLKVTND